MQNELRQIQTEAILAITEARSPEEMQELHRKYLGKKGKLTSVLKSLGSMDPEERKVVGMLANEIKERLQLEFKGREASLESEKAFLNETIDLSLPGKAAPRGRLHPSLQMMEDLNEAFRSLNFDIYEGNLITTEEVAFDFLNFPQGHPARESMDTYWLVGEEGREAEREAGSKGETPDPRRRRCLRPHLTGDSVLYLREHGAPARVVYPGQVFRNETTDAGHDRAFFQYEALIVDRDFSFSSGLLLVKTILSKVFGREVEVRMRAGFFPFVEPGFEIDMRCQVCGGKGCRVCKNVGWIEVMPGGTPHPNVLRAAGLDPFEWTGFYINVGLDRLVMMRYGIDDVRLFHGCDLRFLRQFN